MSTSSFDINSLHYDVPHGETISAKTSASTSWLGRTPNLGPGIVRDDFTTLSFGLDLYLQTLGLASVSVNASATAPTVALNYNAAGRTSLTELGNGMYKLDVSSSSNSGPATFSMSAPSAKVSLDTRLLVSNGVDGRFCAADCWDFGGDLGSFDASAQILSLDTSGKLNFLGLPTDLATNIEAASKLFEYGKLIYTAPEAISGTTASSDQDVLSARIDVARIIKNTSKLKPLNGSLDLPFDLGTISYDVLSASSGLTASLVQSGSVDVDVAFRATSFQNADGTDALVPVQFTRTVFGPTHGTYTSSRGVSGLSCDDVFGPGIPTNLNDPIAQQCFTSHEVTTTEMVSGVGEGSYVVGDGVTDLSHIKAVTQTIYTAKFDYESLFDVNADFAFDALGGSFPGVGSFGPVFSWNPTFPVARIVLGSGDFRNDVSTFETVSFDGSSPPRMDGVPEPAIWAVMVLGFFAAGRAVRRERVAREPARIVRRAIA